MRGASQDWNLLTALSTVTSSLVLADPMSAPRLFKSRLIILAIILAIGVFLRLPPELFQPDTGPLHALESLHP
ncbi:MAG: hypothetical protein DME42_05605, partial [Verrucomicrobia bacterium]